MENVSLYFHIINWILSYSGQKVAHENIIAEATQRNIAYLWITLKYEDLTLKGCVNTRDMVRVERVYAGYTKYW